MGSHNEECLALFVALIVIQLNVGASNGQKEIKDADTVVEEVSLHEEPEYVGAAEFDEDDDEGDDDDDENVKDDANEADDEDDEHDADEDDDDEENQEHFDDDNDDD